MDNVFACITFIFFLSFSFHSFDLFVFVYINVYFFFFSPFELLEFIADCLLCGIRLGTITIWKIYVYIFYIVWWVPETDLRLIYKSFNADKINYFRIFFRKHFFFQTFLWNILIWHLVEIIMHLTISNKICNVSLWIVCVFSLLIFRWIKARWTYWEYNIPCIKVFWHSPTYIHLHMRCITMMIRSNNINNNKIQIKAKSCVNRLYDRD